MFKRLILNERRLLQDQFSEYKCADYQSCLRSDRKCKEYYNVFGSLDFEIAGQKLKMNPPSYMIDDENGGCQLILTTYQNYM